jgi:hypothetical protein
VEAIEAKNTIRKSMARKNEVVDSFMKEINNELTKQGMYREINKCVEPLLPPFQVFEKRGSDTKVGNQTMDYSVGVE